MHGNKTADAVNLKFEREIATIFQQVKQQLRREKELSLLISHQKLVLLSFPFHLIKNIFRDLDVSKHSQPTKYFLSPVAVEMQKIFMQNKLPQRGVIMAFNGGDWPEIRASSQNLL